MPFTPGENIWFSKLRAAPLATFPDLLKATKTLGTSLNFRSTRLFNIEIWKSKTSSGKLTIFNFLGPENLAELEKHHKSQGSTKSKNVLSIEEQKLSSAFINKKLSELGRLLTSQRMPRTSGTAKATMSAIKGADKFVVITTTNNLTMDLNGAILDQQAALTDWWSFTHDQLSFLALTRTPQVHLPMDTEFRQGVTSLTFQSRLAEGSRKE